MAVVDDIGSFPLPEWMSQQDFNKIYPIARKEVILKKRAGNYDILKGVVLSSMEEKIKSGLDVATYPQHYDMHRQFLEPIESHQKEPYLIENNNALIPEVEVIRDSAEEISREFGKRIDMRVCVTGPVELYLRTSFGTNIYTDVLENLARSVNLFLKKSVIKSKHLRTSIVSLDEPSLGYADLLNVDNDDIVKALETAVRGLGIPVQIHFHTLKSAGIALEANGVTVLTGEFAATPGNIDLIKKRDLERYDKFLRAGVTRTNIDSIIAEYLDKGVEPPPHLLVDSKSEIKKRVKKLDSIFGERIFSWGPDCGLGSWPSQAVASQLLRNTVEAVKESFK